MSRLEKVIFLALSGALLSFILFLVALSSIARADIKLMDAEKLEINYEKFKPGRRDPYAPEKDGDWNYRTSLNFNINMVEYLYWNNYVHTESVVSGAVKTVGWEWWAGVHLHSQVDLYMHHHSFHVMEEDRPTKDGHNIFPVEDSYGIKFKILEDNTKKSSIFK